MPMRNAKCEMRNNCNRRGSPFQFPALHFAFRIPHFAFFVLLLAGGPALAGTSLADALEWSRTWTFGDSRAPIDAVERLLPSGGREADNFAKAAAAALPGATPDARRFYCDILGRSGSEAAVEPLAAAARDPETSSAALMAFQRVPGAIAAKALAHLLDDAETDDFRVAVLHAMGQRGDARAADTVRGHLKDPADRVAVSAAWALLRLAGSRAAAGGAVADLGPHRARRGMEEPFIEARLAAAASSLASGRRDEAAAAYEALIKEGPPRIVGAGLRGLAAARGDSAIPVLLDRLSDPNEEARGAAARALAELPGPAATTAVASALPGAAASNAEADHTVVLAGILAARGDPGAAPALRVLAREGKGTARVACIRALARAGTAEDVLVLAGLAAAGDQRPDARDSLDELAAPGTDEAILSGAEAATPAVAGELLRAAAARRIPGAGPVITRALSSPDTDLRIAALGALEKAGTADDFPALLHSLTRTGDEDERDAAKAALAAVISRDEERRDRLCGAVLDAVPASSGAMISALLGLAAPYGGERALNATVDAARGRDADVADEAVSLLAEWPDPAALPELERMSGRGTAPDRATVALRGTLRIAEMDGVAPVEKMRLCDRAMRLATRNEERKLALAVYAKTGCPGALKVLIPLMGKPGLKDEARHAALSLAEAIVAAEPATAGKAANEVLKRTKDGEERERAQKVAEQARENAGYITLWEASGPYSAGDKKGAELFDVTFAPEEDGTAEWKTAVSAGCNKFPAGLDLKALFKDDNQAAYVRCRVTSDRARTAVLQLGSDDGVKAWLNGKLVHSNNAEREMKPGDDTAPVSLKKGVNVLLLKVVQGSGDWGVCARIAAKDGTPLTGLRSGSPSDSCLPAKALKKTGKPRKRGSARRR